MQTTMWKFVKKIKNENGNANEHILFPFCDIITSDTKHYLTLPTLIIQMNQTDIGKMKLNTNEKKTAVILCLISKGSSYTRTNGLHILCSLYTYM